MMTSYLYITLAAQAETREAVEVQATQWPIVTAFVSTYHFTSTL